MIYSLSIQHTYDHVEMALFVRELLVDRASVTKEQASARLLVTMYNLLARHEKTAQDLSYIAANQGPGPFTTMRVVIATINGISFSIQVPLIGIDGLDAFVDEQKNNDFPVTVALLNAFSQDAYFCIDTTHERIKGCSNIKELLHSLQKKYDQQPIRFIGSGVTIFKEQIVDSFGSFAYLPEPLPLQCSLAIIGTRGFERWQKKEALSNMLLPLYLKNQIVQEKRAPAQ